MAYEVVFGCQVWDNVHIIALMESVKQGQQPVIPLEADKRMFNLIKECWLGDPEARPTAAAVLQIFENCLVQSEDDVPDRTTVTDSATQYSNDLGRSDSLLRGASQLEAYTYSLSDELAFDSTIEGDQTSVHSSGISELMLLSQTDELEVANLKALLNITEISIELPSCHDIILVQPTGSGKSVYFVLPALLSPRKVSIVVEPVVAIIINQVETLQRKGIDATATDRAAGTKKVS